VNGEHIPVGNWYDLLITFIEKFISENNPKIGDLFYRPLLPGSKRPFLLKGKPNGKARQISTGHWVYVNINVPSLVNLIGKLCRYCDVNLDNVEITYTPKTNGVFERKNAGQEENDAVTGFVPDSIIVALAADYPNGFTFDTTAVRLLSEKSGVEVDGNIQTALKRLMFRRNDALYFLLDVVAAAKTRKDIIDFADMLLDDYGCFEIRELYALFDSLNEKCVDGLEHFEAFYNFINKRDVRCVTHYGTRIARVQNKGIHSLFADIAQKIISITHNEFGGVISEDDLRERFPGFGAGLLAHIIKEHAEALVKTKINGIVCYQTLDALGLSDEFSDTLAETLSEIDGIGLAPSEEVLHTALSLRMGLNFKAEYNIPDDTTFRRVIAAYYQEAPQRAWNRGVFAEARD
jgi:hypothetical protein